MAEGAGVVGTPLVCFLPLQAPSMNSLLTMYCRGTRPIIETKPEVRLFRLMMTQQLPRWNCPTEGWLNVFLRFHQPWHYLNGKLKRQDVPNLIKCVLDCLSQRYGFDDSRVWQLCCEKSEVEPIGISIGISHHAEGPSSPPPAPGPVPHASRVPAGGGPSA